MQSEKPVAGRFNEVCADCGVSLLQSIGMNIFKGTKNIGVIAFVSILLVGCQYGLKVKIIQNEEDKNISFQIHDNSDVSGISITSFTVYKCSDIKRRDKQGFYPDPDKSEWSITTKNPDNSKIGSQIKYGSTSESFITQVQAKPLANGGCYVVYAGATDNHGNPRIATVGFNIDKTGKAFRLSDTEYQELFNENKG